MRELNHEGTKPPPRGQVRRNLPIRALCTSAVLALWMGWLAACSAGVPAGPASGIAKGRPPAPGLREQLPGYGELLRRAQEWPVRGVAAYLPPRAAPPGDQNVFEEIALLGIPFVVVDRFPMEAPAAFFSLHALSDPQFIPRIRRYLASGRRALITSGLASRLGGIPGRYGDRVFVLNRPVDSRSLLKLSQTTVDRARNFVLYPFGIRIEAPPNVSLSFHGHEAMLVQNFNPFAAGLKITFRRPQWPEVREIQTAEGEQAVGVAYNLAQLQIAPRTARLLRLVLSRGGR